MNQNEEEQLELYLDGLMSEDESEAFLRRIDPQVLRAAVELDDQLTDSLANISQPTPLDERAIEEAYLNARPKPTTRTDTNRRSVLRLAVAAILLVAAGLGIWFTNSGNRVDPFFESRPLVSIYQETVERGFRPVYNCEEPSRFAATFEQNHGQSLALAELPLGSRMLGLSTLGGISRNTTAMLCEVNDRKVIVFVDRVGNGNLSEALPNESASLNVFVEHKNGLVFCEVSPLDSPKMIQYFKFVQ